MQEKLETGIFRCYTGCLFENIKAEIHPITVTLIVEGTAEWEPRDERG